MPDRDDAHALATPALIAHIVDRFHETHRRDLPVLVARARALGDAGTALAAHLASMAKALELHMFKEEMRLFPMMEHGGGRLIGHLIDDLVPEHRAHEEAVARLQAMVAALPASSAPDDAIDTLRAGTAALVADLTEHVRIEDDVLFRRFDAYPRTSGPGM
jgi:regulator of cell morphogenesis and NO signaling